MGNSDRVPSGTAEVTMSAVMSYHTRTSLLVHCVFSRFEWQVGYGAFTIGISQIAATTDYILNQERHHAKKSFAEEWKLFLERHGLSEDEE